MPKSVRRSVGKTLLASIDVNIEGVDMLEILVEYPWKPVLCSVCNGFGHSKENCRGAKRVWKANPVKINIAAPAIGPSIATPAAEYVGYNDLS